MTKDEFREEVWASDEFCAALRKRTGRRFWEEMRETTGWEPQPMDDIIAEIASQKTTLWQRFKVWLWRIF